MDVVRQRVDSLRGSIDVASKPGAGTQVTLRLPLTLAIIDGLLVNIGDACFVLPLANILECIELTQADVERANGKHMANVRGEIVPYIRLREHFNIRTPRPEIEQIMVVRDGAGPVRLCGGSGAGKPPDRDQEPGPVLLARSVSFWRDHSGRRKSGVDSGPRAAGTERDAGKGRALEGPPGSGPTPEGERQTFECRLKLRRRWGKTPALVQQRLNHLEFASSAGTQGG